MKLPRKQNGIALIMAVMIVALAAIMATAITIANQRQLIRTQNIIHRDQAFQFTQMAEDYVIFFLSQHYTDLPDDFKTLDRIGIGTNPETGEISDILPIDFAGVQDSERFYVQGEIIDLQSRLSVNRVSTFPKNDNTGSTANSTTTLSTLLGLLEIDVESSNVLRDSISDWIDADDNSKSGSGAEQYYYLGLEQPYQAANSPILHTSSLKQIRGFEQLNKKQLDELREYLNSLPEDEAKLNINTASDNVLEAIGINSNTMSKIVDSKPYEDVAAFIADVNSQTGTNFQSDDFTVESSYFLIDITGVLDQTRIRLNSVVKLNAADKKSKVVMRIIGEY